MGLEAFLNLVMPNCLYVYLEDIWRGDFDLVGWTKSAGDEDICPGRFCFSKYYYYVELDEHINYK